ncbi:MAG: potassium-transporting ATPase subunit A [Planctomycetaceae bacterium]|nr:potassium-transporting ATPase subunit A [Planctomycetaceae bacterium]
MKTNDWLQFALFLGCLAVITKPVGLYLVRVLDPDGRTWLDQVVGPVERFVYRFLKIDPRREQGWKEYTFSMLAFSFAGVVFTYAILRLQGILPLNRQSLPGLSHHLAFNTAVSFTTNTNWQSYGGEGTMSYFSQVVGLAYHNFVSAAVGIGIAAAFVRAIARSSTKTLGNFWTDLVRITGYLLLPICLVLAIFLVTQGMIQNFDPYTKAITLEGAEQVIAQGPMASQVAIKMLGTNGGGFVNANAAHPFENPTPLSNFVQMLSIFAIGSGLTWYLGRMVKNQAHGWAVWSAMMALFIAGVLVCARFEAAGNPVHHGLGVAAVDGEARCLQGQREYADRDHQPRHQGEDQREWGSDGRSDLTASCKRCPTKDREPEWQRQQQNHEWRAEVKFSERKSVNAHGTDADRAIGAELDGRRARERNPDAAHDPPPAKRHKHEPPDTKRAECRTRDPGR